MTPDENPGDGRAKRRILVVDDDLTLIKMMQIYFSNSGMDVRIESSGMAAIEAVEEFSPDVIILDIMMPEIDGIEVCRRMRRKPNGAGVPIIALTGFHSERRRKEMMEAGANLYLTKPINMAELLGHVKELTAPRVPEQPNAL